MSSSTTKSERDWRRYAEGIAAEKVLVEQRRDELRAELDAIFAVVDHSDTALYDAVKKAKVRQTGAP